jgi:hypothetical protein
MIPSEENLRRMEYKEFLNTKIHKFVGSGIDVSIHDLNGSLYEWQKHIVRWSLKKGKSAIFEDCGLGKTIQQLEWGRNVCQNTSGNVLCIAPLAVAVQTKREGEKFGIEVNVCRSQCDVKPGINITNYEIMKKFDPDRFTGIILDESSILKHQSSSTRAYLTEAYADTPYKLCCTATPSPNDHMELGNHAEFLGIMTRKEMLATFFVHEGSSTQSWRLKKHAEDKFWEWVASWAIVIEKPSDIGFDQEGYDLPPMRIHEHTVKTHSYIRQDGQLSLLAVEAQTLSERRSARKDSMKDRVALAASIANKSRDQFLIWCDLNAESTSLTKLINGAVEVCGADPNEHKQKTMLEFSSGNIRALVSKPSIAGWGMNWQNCSKMIFVGLSDSFEAFYQATRRCWRFGQRKPVDVHIVISDAEGAVKKNIERKQRQADTLKQEMIRRTKDSLTQEIRRTSRISETYDAIVNMETPEWLETEAA